MRVLKNSRAIVFKVDITIIVVCILRTSAIVVVVAYAIVPVFVPLGGSTDVFNVLMHVSIVCQHFQRLHVLLRFLYGRYIQINICLEASLGIHNHLVVLSDALHSFNFGFEDSNVFLVVVVVSHGLFKVFHLVLHGNITVVLEELELGDNFGKRLRRYSASFLGDVVEQVYLVEHGQARNFRPRESYTTIAVERVVFEGVVGASLSEAR